jgi:crossover junction endodeoxyribonuclease RusA
VKLAIKPIAKQRPRLGRRGRVFTPQRTLDFEAQIAEAWDGPCFESPCALVVEFTKDTVKITVKESKYTSGLRGDIDNYVKSIMDGLNGVAYVDDKLVTEIKAVKK